MLGERMPDNVVLIMARRGGDYIAGAFNILGRDTIYGRNWGALREYRFLHFECCYYQAIEFAIKRGLERVEAGAQGPHKMQRGYLPVPTYSAHWIPDPGFRRAVAAFLDRERDDGRAEDRAPRRVLAVPPDRRARRAPNRLRPGGSAPTWGLHGDPGASPHPGFPPTRGLSRELSAAVAVRG